MSAADLYDLTEFAAYVQSDVDTATSTLLRSLVVGLIDEIGTFDPYPVSVKAVALEAAARAYRNPDGLTSETIDDWTGRREAASGVYLTESEQATIRATLPAELASSAAFTISPSYESGYASRPSNWWELNL